MHRPIPRQARWVVPVAVVVAVVGGAQWTTAATAGEPDLPRLSARDLLVKAQHPDVRGLSGTVRSTVDLGVSIPLSHAGVEWSSLLTGTRTLRIATDGAQRQRVDLVGELAQASVVRDDRTLWTWSSSTRQVTRTLLPAHAGSSVAGALGHEGTAATVPALTPQEAADRALAAVSASTLVSVGRSARVAGRPSYDLTLRPQDSASLVGSVRVYVDAATGMALRTVVTARGSTDPAVDIGFTMLRLGPPAASTFAFTPPSGAKVRDVPLPERRPAKDSALAPGRRPVAAVHGGSWTSVVEFSGVAMPGPGRQDSSGSSGLAEAIQRAARPVSGRFGTGQLLTTRLLTVLRTADGRVFAGAVTPAELLRVANAAR